MPVRPIITLLTDFGVEDSYVAEMKGSILSVAPDAALVDVTHLVPPQDVLRGALVLRAAYAPFPPGTVHLAIVDPGVGTERHAVAARAGGHAFVGPDNGLLSLALEHVGAFAADDDERKSGPGPRRLLAPGAVAARLDRPHLWRPDVSPTFHGRDVFGPVAAHLAAGVPIEETGAPLRSLVVLPVPAPTRLPDGAVRGQVIAVDRFGNLTTDLRAPHVAGGDPERLETRIAGRVIAGMRTTYGDGRPGELVVLIGSAGFVEVAAVNDSAARSLGVGVGAPVIVQARRG